MNARRNTPRYSLWIIPAAILIGAILFGIFVLTANLMKPAQASIQQSTAVLTLIHAPTSTPLLLMTPGTNPTVTPDTSGLTIGGIGVGIYVQISGTDGTGLRLRKEPGIESEILFIGYDAEVFKVTDGPRELDGYVWWYLTAPYDESRSGWAAANYLTIIDLEP